MKKARTLATMMVVASLVSATVLPAMATSKASTPDQNYAFSFESGVSTAFSANTMTKQTANNWVIYVDNITATRPVTYAMLWTLYSDWDWCVGSKTVSHSGNGTVIGEYYNAEQVIGTEFWAGARLHSDDVSLNRTISGTWNVDAP